MRFYLDESISHEIATIARGLGLDVTSSYEAGQNGTNDESQLLFAATAGRCVVTQNYRDFIIYTQRFQALGWLHAGVLFVPRHLPKRLFAATARALARYTQRYPDGLPPYTVDYLQLESSG